MQPVRALGAAPKQIKLNKQTLRPEPAVHDISAEKATIANRVAEAINSHECDVSRAATFACLIDESGAITSSHVLQLGSYRDIVFYERDVVELCFSNSANAVIIVFRMPDVSRRCSGAILARLQRFAHTLSYIEMNLPYVIWQSGCMMAVLRLDADIANIE